MLAKAWVPSVVVVTGAVVVVLLVAFVVATATVVVAAVVVAVDAMFRLSSRVMKPTRAFRMMAT